MPLVPLLVVVLRDPERPDRGDLRRDPIAELRLLRGARRDRGRLLVTDGLRPGDRVVVEGFQKFAAGDKVRPQGWDEADASGDPGVPPPTSVQQ